MNAIAIPQTNDNFWADTTGVICSCGGMIEWAEAAYAPGTRACRSCLTMFSVRGKENSRRLVPQMIGENNCIQDAPDDTPEDELYHVPEDLYPGWHIPLDTL
jgi:hypothetical protein